MSKSKRFLVSVLSAVLLAALTLGILSAQVAASDVTGLGNVIFSWQREIYQGVTLERTFSENGSGQQKAYTVTFDPQNTDLQPILNYGPYVMGGDIMSDMVSQVEATGKKVVFAVNGDAYDTSNGVSNGIMIADGKLIVSSSGAEGLGITEDGRVIFGSTSLNITAKAGDMQIAVSHFNRERKLDTNGVYLLTEEFSQTTKSSQAGVEVVLRWKEDSLDGVRIGSTMNAVVESVQEVANNPSLNQTAIGSGKAVLSTHVQSAQYAALRGLTPGQEIEISVQNGSDVDWASAKVAMGIFHVLVRNGVETPGIRSNGDIHPRTAFGTKADGSIVLFQCDGRQPGFADGVTFAEIVDYMVGLGCVNVFNFDGGGSSTITATLPGDESPTILNRPSDGHERANCNALLFAFDIETAEPAAEKLHVYPDLEEGYASKIYLLENGKMNFKVGATDADYRTVALDASALSYEVEGDIGTVDENGTFTARQGSGEGILKVSSGAAEGSIAIKIVDSITKLESDRTILSVAPSKETRLTFKAYQNGVPVALSSEALTFELSDDSLGCIAPDGTFVAGEGQGTGELTVSYKDYALVMPVEIGKLPVALNDFEEELEEVGWRWRYTNPGNGGSGRVSINRDERFVKSGDGSLRIDYDFATNPVTGTIAIEVGPQSAQVLEGQPKAIGCWIYGDGKGAWMRIQLKPAAYAGDVYVNWKGWKYIETEIPATASFPYELVWGVRLICTPTLAANYQKGTIYVDSLRAVYDFKNDDSAAPVVEENSITPADGAEGESNQTTISLIAYDPQVEGSAQTGINKERTKLWINGIVYDNLLFEDLDGGRIRISYIPSALTRLRAGPNRVKLRVEDNYGNKTFAEWEFLVQGYNVYLTEEKPDGDYAYAGEEFEYTISPNSYEKFERLELELTYNTNNLHLLEAPAWDTRLTVEEQLIENGRIRLVLSGMKALTKPDEAMLSLRFKVNESPDGRTELLIEKAVVTETGDVEGTALALEGYDAEVDYKYTLSYTGSTVGSTTELSVRDIDAQPAEGLRFTVASGSQAIAFDELTDADGRVTTDLFGSYPLSTQFTLYAVDTAGAISNTITLTVLDSLGAMTPDRVVVTTGADPAVSVGISWTTHKQIEHGTLRIGTSSDLSDAQEAAAGSRIVITTANALQREYRAFGVAVYGLTPDTQYFYQVGSEEGGWSPVYSFRTARSEGDVNIAFYGDIQGSASNMQTVIEMLKGICPDLDMSLLAGDVTDNGHFDSDWQSLYAGMGDYFASQIWAATIGNHDEYFDAQAFTSFFYGPDNGTEATARNYWFTVGDAVIYNLDTQSYGYDPDFSKQIANMKRAFESQPGKFRIVLMHRSAYPMNYDEADVRALSAAFELLNVDLVLSGHDHIYSRTQMQGGEKSAQGPVYIVGGSASGSKYYDADVNGRPWQDVVYDENNPVFTLLKVRENKLLFEAYAIVGGQAQRIDSVEIMKKVSVSYNAYVSGPERVTVGESAIYTITPTEGFEIAGITVNGRALEVASAITLENITVDTEIYVTLRRIPSEVEPEQPAAGESCTAAGAQLYAGIVLLCLLGALKLKRN